MKKIATRFVAIIVASILTAATLFTATNVAAQEAAKPVIEGTIIPAAEVMKMIKEKGIQFLRDDGVAFKVEGDEKGLFLGPVKGTSGSAKIVASMTGSETICWETYGKGKNGCLKIVKTGTGAIVILNLKEKIGLQEEQITINKLIRPEI